MTTPAVPLTLDALYRETPPADDGKVLHLRILLPDTDPLVWRAIEVSSSATFWDLHMAIQDAFAWLGKYPFRFRSQRDTHIREDPLWALGTYEAPSNECYIAPYLALRKEVWYAYGYGHEAVWNHMIMLGAVVDATPGKYPRCIEGESAAPPEDSGPRDFSSIKHVLRRPGKHEYREVRDWLADGHDRKYWPYDPRHFDCKSVVFTNAKWRKEAYLRLWDAMGMA